MHEVSLVQHIINTLKQEFPNDIHKLIAIHLTLGDLSNVQPTLMQNAFYAILPQETLFHQNMQLHIQQIPIVVHCDDCNIDSEVKYYKFVCEKCGKPTNNILQGEEMLITKVEFED